MAETRKSAKAPGVDGQDEANRRQALIRASARLFREKGFEATTVRDIAGAVGMRSGSPFYHFSNKQEILKAVMEEGLRQGLNRTEEALRAATTPQQRFHAMVRTHYGILHDEGSEFIAVLLYDWRSLPDEHKQDIIAVKDRYDLLWQASLKEMLDLGLIGANSQGGKASADEVKTARLMIMGAINFTVTWYKQRSGRGAMDLEALADRTVRFFMRGSA